MSDESLCLESLANLAECIRRRAISSPELVNLHLERISRLDERLHAFLSVRFDQAIDCAEPADQAIARQESVGPLQGIPISVKDLIDTADSTTTYGSRIFATHIPTQTAPAITRLAPIGQKESSALPGFVWV